MNMAVKNKANDIMEMCASQDGVVPVRYGGALRETCATKKEGSLTSDKEAWVDSPFYATRKRSTP